MKPQRLMKAYGLHAKRKAKPKQAPKSPLDQAKVAYKALLSRMGMDK